MKSAIAQFLGDALAGLPELADAVGDLSMLSTVERTRDATHGNFASNVAMRLAKPARRSPRDLAAAIIEKLPEDFYSSRSFADFLMDAIRENRNDGKPFFGYLAFTAPHDPVHVPEPWLSKYRGDYDEGYDVLKAARWDAA